MTEEQFNKIEKIRHQINAKKSQISAIDAILSGTNMECVVSAHPNTKYRMPTQHYAINTEQVIVLLNSDRALLVKELSDLESTFDAL